MIANENLPELLAPAGSPEALDAAIAAGADAVYFGGAAFNARMGAKNFGGDALSEAIRKCRFAGVKTNITLNTLILDREIDGVLRYVEELYRLGADALIIADLGAAGLIRRYFPELELHASTQLSGHNIPAARELSALGFRRMVAARELSFRDLTTLCRSSPIETELFIHGAICVSQSGQCLASSLIGGRSGNRGECAQPCRLPYQCEGCRKESYALSLKDMCLAEHIGEILSLGAASLKIEGRMKSPSYVYGVTRIYRRLLDERRNATAAEVSELRALFSRSGFTDGYFTGSVDREMLGIRTDADKAMSAGRDEPINYAKLCENRRRPATLDALFRLGEPSRLTIRSGELEATVYGQIPEPALNRPLTVADAMKNLTKLGGTPFRADHTAMTIDETGGGLILPVSALNALRRDAVAALTAQLTPTREAALPERLDKPSAQHGTPQRTARFASASAIPDNAEDFTIIYLPLEDEAPDNPHVNGVILPPVIFDSELDAVRQMLTKAAGRGIRHALVSNLGHLALARGAGMEAHGDFRLNCFNAYSVEVLRSLGFADVIAAPELTLPQLRDLAVAPVLYGRLPLMTLEKCVIRDLYSCADCTKKGFLPLIDRTGTAFPLHRAWPHRNILYNSVPLYMADKRSELERAGLSAGHFIFTDESPAEAAEIIEAYKQGRSTDKKIRRLPK